MSSPDRPVKAPVPAPAPTPVLPINTNTSSTDVPDEKHSSHTAYTLAPQNTTDINRTLSPTGTREVGTRLNDDLELLRAEQLVSHQEHENAQHGRKSRSNLRRSGHETEDAFNQPTKPAHAEQKENNAALYKLWMFLKKFPRMIRYLVYMIPGGCLLLIPVLLGYFAFSPGQAAVGGPGGVYLMWFGIWLEIVWCTLWLTRMITSLMPHIFRLVAKVVGSSTPKKWRDIGEQLELHTALFLWLLALLISFIPTVNNHRAPAPGDDPYPYIAWIDIVNKVIIALFVLAALNWVEKILLQWIATSFHQRTYQTRIDNNKADMGHLVHLYEYSKERIAREDSIWDATEHPGGYDGSGTRTPMQTIQKSAIQAWHKVGAAANRVGNDIIGRKVNTNHPKKVVLELLRNTGSAHTLARLLYRSLVQPEQETVTLEDMKNAYPAANVEEAEAAFMMFDKDLNGDLSMEEMELVCNEIHLEKKAIGASLKDLDSVIKKLDKVFLFVIFIIAAIVFISIISGSAAAGLASAGSAFLGLAWVLQATAQEFLQSIIFVFVKHPFDVGDRVTVYGNAGSLGRGDDYYVTEVSLLYTEFKKMEGHIVQAPNSLLNTLFILNQRRSNGLADPIELKVRFGTPGELIEELKARMLEFCLANKRDYQPRIITEVRTLDELRSATMNFIFFHKSSFQNELLRLTRHNKFAAELMRQMIDLGIQGPLRNEPGGSREFPMYWIGTPTPPLHTVYGQLPGSQPPPAASSEALMEDKQAEFVLPERYNYGDSGAQLFHANSPSVTEKFPALGRQRTHSTTTHGRARAESRIAPTIQENLGDFQDVFESRRDESSTQHVSRLQSIREREREREVDEAATSTGFNMARVGSAQSTTAGDRGRRLFGSRRGRDEKYGGPAAGPSQMV